MKKKVWDPALGNTSPMSEEILLIMKLILCIILFSFFGATASESYTRTTKLSSDFKNATVRDALDAVENQSDFSFSSPQQQTGKVKGKVVDEENRPLPGATIIILGTSRGVISNNDGTYTIDTDFTDKLVFSFIGMESQTVEVGNRTTINIQLKAKTSELEDVTVVAFGKQKKESVISSISTVKPGELKVPSSNLTAAMAGRLSGVVSYQTSGEPGQDDAAFFVRGVTTFGYKKSPLILIDGVELTSADLSRLQTDDLSSFSILKDATATALYGARGANGVILITTKEGIEGKAKVSVRFENSISAPTRKIEFADPITYMEMHNEASKTRNPNGILPYSYEKIYRTRDPNRNKYVYPANDWQDMLFKDFTNNQRLNVNVNGGGEVARYYFAGSFTQDNGILKVDKKNNFNNNIDLKKYLLRSNININLTKTTKATVRFYATFDEYTGPIDGGTELYKKVMKSNPVLFPAYYKADAANKNAQHILFGNAGTLGDYINPYADMVKGYRDESRSLMLAQFEIDQDLKFITEGLSLKFLGNINRTSSYGTNRYYNPYYYAVDLYDIKKDEYSLIQLNPQQATEALSYSEGDKKINSVTYLEGRVNYAREFNKKHGLSGLLVFVLRDSKIANAGDLQSSLPSRNLGLSGRCTYAYKSKYFAEFNFGYNGSERFSSSERYGFFPSAGLGWIVSNEDFWEPLKSKLTKLKFKATYGLVGNDAIGDEEDRFFYLSNVNLNNSKYGYRFGTDFKYSRDGVSISRYANDQVTWETAKKLNIGVELDLFDKIAIQADWFSEYRTNILMTRADLPTTMGLQATMKGNIGEAASSGVDISMDVNNRFSSGIWITSRVNFTYATSQFKVYEEPDFEAIGAPWRSRVGYSLSQDWGYVAERLFIDDAEAKNSPEQFGEYGAGDIKYRDINKDGRINELDQVPLGYPTSPEIIYGFGSSIGYKNIDFSFFFQGLGRRSFWIDTRNTAPFLDTADGVLGNNALLQVYADNVWLEEIRDPYAMFPRLSVYPISNNEVHSSWFMRDGSFLRLKSLEVGYAFPKRMTDKINVNQVRLYLSGTNLLSFSNFKLWDVEMGSNGLGYPIQRVFNIGVQVSF